MISLFGIGIANADILPEGQKGVTVCAYFNNTEDFLEEMAIYGYETGPVLDEPVLDSYIDGECFRPSYKMNTLKVYAVTVDHAAELDLETYDPSADEMAYPTNIQPEMGVLYIDDTSTIESITNEYTIIGLDEENHVLEIEPAQTTTTYNDETEDLVEEGKVTMVSTQYDDDDTVADDDTAADDDVAADDDTMMEEDIFTDVDSTSDYYDALKYLKDNEIIGGYPDGSFKPDQTINRAEFTKIVMGANTEATTIDGCLDMKLATTEYTEGWNGIVSIFLDVTTDTNSETEPEWYFNYVCQAQKTNLIAGYPDGTFKPAQNINFVEAAKIITKSALDQAESTSEPWYMDYVMALEGKNAIPMTITTFEKKITRGEMAEMMYRLLNGVTDRESMTYAELS